MSPQLADYREGRGVLESAPLWSLAVQGCWRVPAMRQEQTVLQQALAAACCPLEPALLPSCLALPILHGTASTCQRVT